MAEQDWLDWSDYVEDQKSSVHVAFEIAIRGRLGDRVRHSDAQAMSLWSALTNIAWRDAHDGRARYSFGEAGHFVASLQGAGDYLTWYMCGEAGVVSDEIRFLPAAEGWTPERL